MQTPNLPPFVLYVAPLCKLSIKLQQDIVARGLGALVIVQDVTALRGQKLPEWLKGTPILVDRQTSEMYPGSLAQMVLDRITQQRAQSTAVTPSRKGPWDNGLFEIEHPPASDKYTDTGKRSVGFQEQLELLQRNRGSQEKSKPVRDGTLPPSFRE